jgi:hypothetical protein
MVRPKNNKLTVRLSNSNLKILNQIKHSGAFDTDSQTIRFCIEFTNAILCHIPETLAESFIALNDSHEDD